MMGRDQSVTTTMSNAAVEKHVKFWDRKNKGYITPVDTVFGFIHLGYGIVVSVTLGTFLGVLFSYSTQDSWIPDPLCRTRMEKLQKASQGAPYGVDGQLDLAEFDKLFEKHAKSDISGKTITLKELLEWNEATYRDPLNWSAIALEWLAVYLLVGNKGVVKKEDIQAAYDGTLFYKVRDRNKQHRVILNASSDSSTPRSSSSSSLNISGVMVPKTYVRQLETQLNNAVNILPRSTVLTLENRLRNWLSFVQQQQQQRQQQQYRQKQPILRGVSTPGPTRRSLFGINSHGEEEENGKENGSIPSLFTGGLTGVLSINLLDRPMAIAGVQGYQHDSDNSSNNNSDEEETISYLSGLKHSDEDKPIDETEPLSYNLAGVRPEGEHYYRDSPQINWLRSGTLTGVSPSTSTTTNNLVFNDEDEEVDDDERLISLTGLQPAVSTPPLTDTGSVHSDHEQDSKDEQRRRQSTIAATPPFAGSPSSQEEDEDDDLPDSPTDKDTDDSIKKSEERASWPTLTEVVPSED